MIIGFPIFATMIILGSWWASIAWSRYWGWDPKETAALVTWLTYAVYLHARNQRRWAGRPAALLLVIGFGMVLVTYSGSSVVLRAARVLGAVGRDFVPAQLEGSSYDRSSTALMTPPSIVSTAQVNSG